MLIDNSGKHPFTGAGSVFSTPIPPNNFDPKQWGINAAMLPGGNTLTDANALFITNNVQIGDPFFITDTSTSDQIATAVTNVLSETQVVIGHLAPVGLDGITYKVGEAAQHTFNSLIDIIVKRGLQDYVIHWSKCWTHTPFPDFRPDEKGDVYIIDPEEERKLNGMNRVNGELVNRPTPEEIAAAAAQP